MNNTLKQTTASPLTSLNSESTTIGDELNNILDRITAIGVSLMDQFLAMLDHPPSFQRR